MTDQALLDIFRESTLDQLARAEQAALELERAAPAEAGPLVEAVFRCVHTVKGDSATLGLAGLSRACHEFETSLEELRQGRASVSPALVGGLLEALDCLRACLDEPGHDPAGTAVALSALASLLARAEPARPGLAALPTQGGEAAQAEALELGFSVRAAHLDQLLEGLSELMTTRESLSALARGEGRFEYLHLAGEMERQLSRLGQSILSMRLLSLKAVVPKYRRLVRDLAAQAGKDVEFVVSGEMCELDKTLIEKLNTPLVHLLRNAVRHGVEPPGERLASGKPARGTVRLEALQDGSEIVITVGDDGAGVDTAAVFAKAVRAGLAEPSSHPGEAALLDMVFLPGLSTSESVDGVSGRGVGLDAVRAAVLELGGEVGISSAPGRGTLFTLRAPLSLSLLDCLRVRVGRERYFLPIECVEQCLEEALSPGRTADAVTVAVQDSVLTCFVLQELFDLPREDASPMRHVVVIRHGGERFAVAVDETLGLTQVMVKPLGGKLVEQECFMGAAPDEDGSMSLIVAPGFLAKLARE